MAGKVIDAKTWTQLELRGLLEDEDSHVYFERCKKHLGLHPFHLSNLNTALKEILGSTLNSYDAKLNGIILSYKNPKILNKVATILNDACFIHVDIEADFYIFRPNIGDELKGIVNKKSQDHVGILLNKVFNVSIPRPDEDENWPGFYTQIGQEVRFTITYLELKGRLPYIRGSMDAENYLRNCKPLDDTFEAVDEDDEPVAKPNAIKFSYSDEEGEEDSNEFVVDRKSRVNKVIHTRDDSDIDEKLLPRKLKELENDDSEDEIHVKKMEKHKAKTNISFPEIKLDLYGEDPINEDRDIDDELYPKSKILKKETNRDEVPTKKKKRNKVKMEETSADLEKSVRHISENSDVVEETLPPKSKKLKREHIDDKTYVKKSLKTKAEVEVTYCDIESDMYERNAYQMKTESGNEQSTKMHKIKAEVLSSEAESDVNKTKQSELPNERRKKKHKVKLEVFALENESDISMPNGNIRIENDFSENKSKKKHKIKTEAISLET
ncbi:DNA-directed RNA polymerase I subunit RPA43 [Neodiprion pinetum]|uniref:DNA-directed RNA polymerase I subunit RPA43 n=1 Tax=Neodiprion pinetum TaxID=441929 RepID=UPI001EDE6178|nr:DNA-directed RNA polymerase I subunit RPA43 [Neodiprion pinetum]